MALTVYIKERKDDVNMKYAIAKMQGKVVESAGEKTPSRQLKEGKTLAKLKKMKPLSGAELYQERVAAEKRMEEEKAYKEKLKEQKKQLKRGKRRELPVFDK